MKYRSLINKLTKKAENKRWYAIKTSKTTIVDRHYDEVSGSFFLYINERFVKSSIKFQFRNLKKTKSKKLVNYSIRYKYQDSFIACYLIHMQQGAI